PARRGSRSVSGPARRGWPCPWHEERPFRGVVDRGSPPYRPGQPSRRGRARWGGATHHGGARSRRSYSQSVGIRHAEGRGGSRRAASVGTCPIMLSSYLDLVFAPVCLGCDGPITAGDRVRLICRLCRVRLRPLPAPHCGRCGAPLPRTGRAPGPVCGECGRWPPVIRAARSACLLYPPADRLVHQLKYRGWRALAEPMAERMAALSFPRDVEAEARLVVPVPTTAERERQRGYNQAELLA